MKELTSKMTTLIIENEKTTKILTQLQQTIRRLNMEQGIKTENNEDVTNRLPLSTEQHILEMEHFLLQEKNENKVISLNVVNVAT